MTTSTAAGTGAPPRSTRAAAASRRGGCIRVGIGGWNYAPWRETFYPPGVPQRKELHHASRVMGAIEINSSFYRMPAGETFAKWRDETPPGFVFSVKAPRYLTHRRHLAEGLALAAKFTSVAARLEDRLGPLLWQLSPAQTFDADDLERFFTGLPHEAGGQPLRHAIEVRHASFACPAFVELAQRHAVAVVYTDSPQYPQLADLTADFVYARLMRSQGELSTGYPEPALHEWAEQARRWAAGDDAEALPHVGAPAASRGRPRDVFVYFINGAKERAPGAARALMDRLRVTGSAPQVRRASGSA